MVQRSKKKKKIIELDVNKNDGIEKFKEGLSGWR